MNKRVSILQQTEFFVLLFLGSLIVFICPLLIMSGGASVSSVMLSIFLPWAFIILVLFLVNKRSDSPNPEALATPKQQSASSNQQSEAASGNAVSEAIDSDTGVAEKRTWPR